MVRQYNKIGYSSKMHWVVYTLALYQDKVYFGNVLRLGIIEQCRKIGYSLARY